MLRADAELLRSPDPLTSGSPGDREAAMPCQSTAIRDIRYEDDRQKLFVTFVDGGEYVYVGVPGALHRSLVEADSQGRFFIDQIRDAFPYNRLDRQTYSPDTP